MTRGKIIYVSEDNKVFSTVEFNGDMYPEGKAEEVQTDFYKRLVVQLKASANY